MPANKAKNPINTNSSIFIFLSFFLSLDINIKKNPHTARNIVIRAPQTKSFPVSISFFMILAKMIPPNISLAKSKQNFPPSLQRVFLFYIQFHTAKIVKLSISYSILQLNKLKLPAKYLRKENIAGNLYVTKRQENSSLFPLHSSLP